MMEVFAGFLEHTDHHIGRLVDFLESIGQLDNTIIMLISDNGASPEGGPTGSVNENKFFNNIPESLEDNLAALDDLGGPKYFNHYSWGWTWAGNTPFRRWKRETYRGGVSDPFIVHWPKGIAAKGEVRHQYAHAIDMVPTILDCLEIEPPEQIRGITQSPIEGVSFAHTFDKGDAPTKHHTQYFEMFAHRSLYHDGWRAVCPVPGPSFSEAGLGFGAMELTREKLTELDTHGWELYHIDEDFAENHDLAEEHRDRLIEMISLWYAEAGKYKVLPLHSSATARLATEHPLLAKNRESYTYYPATSPIPGRSAVSVMNRPHSITAKVEIPEGGSEGVLLSQGDNMGGYTFFVKDNRLHYAYNYASAQEFHIESSQEIPAGEHELRFEFETTGELDMAHGKGTPGLGQLYVDDTLVGQGDIDVTLPIQIGLAAQVSCGLTPGAPITSHYQPPYYFTGTIDTVTVDVSGDLIRDTEAEMRAIMARQ